MKRFVFVLLPLLFVAGCDSWFTPDDIDPDNDDHSDTTLVDSKFYKRSLFLRFTATWCGYCPLMSNAVANATESIPDRLVSIAIHPTSSNTLLSFSSANTLETLFQVSGYPTGILDYRANILNYIDTSVTTDKILAAVTETREMYPAVSGIAFHSEMIGDTIKLYIQISSEVSEELLVNALVLEDGIVTAQAGYTGNYTHMNVVRDFFTNPAGEILKCKKSSITEHTYSLKKPEKISDIEKCKIVVYTLRKFQNNQNGSVPGIKYNNYNGYYVDNCAIALLGDTLVVKYEQNVN